MPEGGLRVLPDLMCWSTWLLDKPWKNVHYSDMDIILLSITRHIYIKIHCMLFDVKYRIGRELSCFFQVSDLEWERSECYYFKEENSVAPNIRHGRKYSVSEAFRGHPSDGQHAFK